MIYTRQRSRFVSADLCVGLECGGDGAENDEARSAQLDRGEQMLPDAQKDVILDRRVLARKTP